MSPRTKEQNERIRKEKREQILNAALEVFADQGFHRASVSALAKKAKISKGLVYNYFSSKEEMLHEIINEVNVEVLNRLHFPEDRPLNDEDMKHFIDVSLGIVYEDSQRYKLFFSIITQRDVAEMMMAEMMEKMMPLIMKMHHYFEQKGFENPTAMMRFFNAAVDGVQMHIMLDRDNFPMEDVKKLMYKILI